MTAGMRQYLSDLDKFKLAQVAETLQRCFQVYPHKEEGEDKHNVVHIARRLSDITIERAIQQQEQI